MTRDFFGLLVECEVSEIEDFAAFRSLFEPFIRKMELILSQGGHKMLDSNFVKVPGDNPYYLTFCITDKGIVFGVYDKKTKKVSGSCNYGDIKDLGLSEVKRLINIIENYIKNNIKMPNLNALDVAWREELLKRKEKAFSGEKKPSGEKADNLFEQRLEALRGPPSSIKPKQSPVNISHDR
ncbi:MAG: hypothetical protein K6G10_01520 [Butyrivibrio sp.]|nr:hypothetical protein [Butyrivibrio sp.]